MGEFENPNEFEDVVQPQETEAAEMPGAQEDEDFAQSQEADIAEMDDKSFSEYIERMKSGDNTAQQDEVSAVPREEQDASEKTQDEPYMVFDTKEAWQSQIDKIIGERLKNTRADKQKYDELASRAAQYYGLSPEESVKKLFEDMDTQEADRRGISIDEYRQRQAEKEDADRWRLLQQENAAREAEIQGIVDNWNKESEQLRAVIPDFDFQKAMGNAVFKADILEKGMSVAAAYIHAEKMSAQKSQSPRKTVSELGAGSGKGNQVGAVDLMNMPTNDFMEKMRRIRDGS